MAQYERTIDVRGHVYTLVAVPTGGGGGWMARVVRYDATGGAATIEGFILDARSRAHDMAAVASMTATGPNAEAAVDRLADDLRVAIEDATMDDAGEIDRRERERPEGASRGAGDADDGGDTGSGNDEARDDA